jgi:transposase
MESGHGKKYPPYQTCHRRFQPWVRSGVLERALRVLAERLRAESRLNLEQAFVDATFAAAKKGASAWVLPSAARLMAHPGVGAITALGFVLIIGDSTRFKNGKKLSSYLGLVPSEQSSGQRRRLGHISKQGNTLLRFLLVEAAQATVRADAEWRRQYLHLAMRRERRIAKVAMARKLAVRLLWMWRNALSEGPIKAFGPHAGQPGTGVDAQ